MEINLKIDTLIIPLDTDHLEEYPAEFDHILNKIIQYKGSAGTLILNKADNKIRYIFVTDTRYKIVGDNTVAEMKARGIDLELRIIKTKENHLDCLKELGCRRVGVNLKRLGIPRFQKLIQTITPKAIETINIPDEQKIEPADIFNFFKTQATCDGENGPNTLVDLDLFKTVPRPNQNPFTLETKIDLNLITHFDLNFTVPETGNDLICGETYANKFKRLFKDDLENKTIIFAALHEINYLLNIRTADAWNAPHLYCFMIATRNKVQLYCNWNTEGLFKPADLVIETKRYEDFYADAKALIKQNPEDIILTAPNAYLLGLLLQNNGNENLDGETDKIIKNKITNEVKKMMDKKNLNELKGFTQAGLIHALALIKLFVKLEALAAENQQVTEKDVAKFLNGIFEENPDFLMNSFKIMVGNGKNGASIHHETSNDLIKWDEPILLDCGTQTKYGTTDISRTILVDATRVKEEFKDDYTLILRAQINGKMIKGKPEMMKQMTQLVPRYFVNQNQKDYKHGTGHGVGHCGCVHEQCEFLEGSVFSVEPGVYIEGFYGVRLEDVVTCQFEGKDGFLGLTPLTFVPYQRNLINENQLTFYEKKYLNGYFELIRRVLKPFLNEVELKYLEINTLKF